MNRTEDVTGPHPGGRGGAAGIDSRDDDVLVDQAHIQPHIAHGTAHVRAGRIERVRDLGRDQIEVGLVQPTDHVLQHLAQISPGTRGLGPRPQLVT